MKCLALALAPLLVPLLVSGAPVADRCAALAGLSTPTLAVAAGRDGPLCRVTMTARPRPSAAIGIELWLPPPARWSGRYYQMGNGGFAGHIDVPTLRAAAARGDAAAATDTGHRGDGFDASWAAGRPDLVEAYAGRSIKVTADAARRVVGAYYGRAARRRYFMGCSFGGRQALVAAARWPADWDGVIAGAPAIRWVDRLASFARIQRALAAPGAAIDPAALPALIAAARARCRWDSAVGCGTRAVERACAGGGLCLSPPRLDALATIEAAGYPLAEADPAGWTQWMLRPDPATGSQLALARQGYRYLFSAGEGWTPADDRFAIAEATRRQFAIGSLAAFERRGGRILSYFGLADPVLPPSFAISDARGVGATATAYRLFPVPGMGHCQGGPVAPAFGQSLPAPPLRDDPRHDIRRALEDWVERGRPPRSLIAATGEGATTLRPTPLR